MFARLYGTILQPSLLHGEEEGDLLLKTAGGVAYRFSCSLVDHGAERSAGQTAVGQRQYPADG